MKIHIDVNVELADPCTYARMVSRWLECSRTALFPELIDRVNSGDTRLWAAVTADHIGSVFIDYSDDSWRDLIARLPRMPASVSFVIDNGKASRIDARVEVWPASLEGPLTQLLADIWIDDVSAGRRDLADRWCDFLYSTIDDADPSFGRVSDDPPMQATPLDIALSRSAEDSAERGRELLRGYSWVTVCPRELAERLGGVEALRSTGAFVQVRPMRDGGVLLRATPTIGEYDEAAMRKVFRALAPVLPAGMPKPRDGWETLRVVYEDAALARER